MSELKLTADSGGGSVSFKGPASTTSNAAVPFVLPVADGSAGTFLKTDGSKNLSFAEAGGGKVLQVVQGTAMASTDEVAISSITFTDTNLDVTITGVASGSKCLIQVNQPWAMTSTGNYNLCGFRILRGSTEIISDYRQGDSGNVIGPSGVGYTWYNLSATNFNFRDIWTMSYLDSSPGTGSVTYKVQAAIETTSNSNTVRVNDFPSYTASAVHRASPSVIQVTEIGA